MRENENQKWLVYKKMRTKSLSVYTYSDDHPPAYFWSRTTDLTLLTFSQMDQNVGYSRNRYANFSSFLAVQE